MMTPIETIADWMALPEPNFGVVTPEILSEATRRSTAVEWLWQAIREENCPGNREMLCDLLEKQVWALVPYL